MKRLLFLSIILISIFTLNVNAKEVQIYFYSEGGTPKTKDFKIVDGFVSYKKEVNYASYKDNSNIKMINSIKGKQFILKKNGTYQVDGKEWYAYNDTTNKIYYFDESETYKMSKIIENLGLKDSPNPVISMYANWNEEGKEEFAPSYDTKAESIIIKAKKRIISIKEELDLDIIYEPNNSQEEKVTWTSSNDKIATVSKGVVTGISKGTVTITAKTKRGLSTNIKIKVTETKKHYVYLKLNANNGTILEEHGDSYQIKNNSIYKDENNIIHKIEYNAEMGKNGIADYNNEDYINLSKVFYDAKKGAEWNTKPDGSGKSYDQNISYKASDFCNASKKDCEVTLYVNWKKTTKTLRVGTFNIGYFHCGTSKYECKPTANDFTKLIKNNDIDLIGLQEAGSEKFLITKKSKEKSNKVIESIGKKAELKYSYITSPRNINAMLSKYKLNKKESTKLPSCGEVRSLDKAIINVNGIDISYYNTHLSYNIDEEKNCPKKHMEFIANKIKDDPNPIILTGDFNSNSIDNYNEFLKPLGFEVAAHNHKYHGKNGKESYMDSVFVIPKEHIYIIEEETILTYLKYSDHNLVFTTLEIKK